MSASSDTEQIAESIEALTGLIVRLSTVPSDRMWTELVGGGWLTLLSPSPGETSGHAAAAHVRLARACGEAGVGSLLEHLGMALPLAHACHARKVVDLITEQAARVTVAWAPASVTEGSSIFVEGPSSGSVTASNGALKGRRGCEVAANQSDLFLAPVRSEEGLEIWMAPKSSATVLSTEVDADPMTARTFIEFDGPAELVCPAQDGQRAWQLASDWLDLWICGEAIGIAELSLRAAVEHAQNRVQFGARIGKFQAVSHALANAYVDAQMAVGTVNWAANVLDDYRTDTGIAVRAAVADSLHASVSACETAIQVLGGIGMTWESPINAPYHRVLDLAAITGGARTARSRVSAALHADEGHHG